MIDPRKLILLCCRILDVIASLLFWASQVLGCICIRTQQRSNDIQAVVIADMKEEMRLL